MRNIAAGLGAALVVIFCLLSSNPARSADPVALLVAEAGGQPPASSTDAPGAPSSDQKSKPAPPQADQKTSAGKSRPNSVVEWWPLLLLLPGVIGLWLAAGKEHHVPDDTPGQNRFFIAAVAGTVWLITLWLMAASLPQTVNQTGVPLFTVFHSKFGFYLFVPVFGYIGALLYVLDLSRRGREDIPKGTEFGMRLIMGPYVAIVMVLFAEELGFAKAQSPIAQAMLAFFSGLLVVLALQGLVEKGQEVLGSWRESERYAPSEIAQELALTKQEDLELRRAGLQLLFQLSARSESALKDDAKRAGLSEEFMLALQKEAQKKQIKKSVGNVAWQALETTLNIKTIEDFAHLSDQALNEVANKNKKIQANGLKILRDGAMLSVAPKPAP